MFASSLADPVLRGGPPVFHQLNTNEIDPGLIFGDLKSQLSVPSLGGNCI